MRSDAETRFAFADVSPIADLLRHAHSLASLTRDRFQPVLQRDPCLADALVSPARLTSLHHHNGRLSPEAQRWTDSPSHTPRQLSPAHAHHPCLPRDAEVPTQLYDFIGHLPREPVPQGLRLLLETRAGPPSLTTLALRKLAPRYPLSEAHTLHWRLWSAARGCCRWYR